MMQTIMMMMMMVIIMMVELIPLCYDSYVLVMIEVVVDDDEDHLEVIEFR